MTFGSSTLGVFGSPKIELAASWKVSCVEADMLLRPEPRVDFYDDLDELLDALLWLLALEMWPLGEAFGFAASSLRNLISVIIVFVSFVFF